MAMCSNESLINIYILSKWTSGDVLRFGNNYYFSFGKENHSLRDMIWKYDTKSVRFPS